MAGVKPRTASGYSADVTTACERTMLTMLSAFGNLKDTLRLVGGLVPRYLTPENSPDVPAHAGTSDVDVVINLELLATGDEYASLADQLKARGFARVLNREGKPSSWRWGRKVDDHLEVVVELLRDAGDERPGRAISINDEEVSAMCIRHVGITADWYREMRLTADLLDGQGLSTETIRFADVPAFVILKALAVDDRKEPKDAADLIHVLKYSGTVAEVAEMFAERIRSGLHPVAMQEGLAALRLRFCDDEHGEGYKKVGPVGYSNFLGHDDEDQVMEERHYAASLIERLLDSINEKTASEPSPEAVL